MITHFVYKCSYSRKNSLSLYDFQAFERDIHDIIFVKSDTAGFPNWVRPFWGGGGGGGETRTIGSLFSRTIGIVFHCYF